MNPRPSSYEALPWVLTPEEVAPLLNVGMCTVYELLAPKQDVLAFMGQGSQTAEAV